MNVASKNGTITKMWTLGILYKFNFSEKLKCNKFITLKLSISKYSKSKRMHA